MPTLWHCHCLSATSPPKLLRAWLNDSEGRVDGDEVAMDIGDDPDLHLRETVSRADLPRPDLGANTGMGRRNYAVS